MSSGDYVRGKVIIVTGAARGFGKLVAAKSAALGAKVVASDVDVEDLKATVAEISEGIPDGMEGSYYL